MMTDILKVCWQVLQHVRELIVTTNLVDKTHAYAVDGETRGDFCNDNSLSAAEAERLVTLMANTNPLIHHWSQQCSAKVCLAFEAACNSLHIAPW
jgi:hypothetical protein